MNTNGIPKNNFLERYPGYKPELERIFLQMEGLSQEDQAIVLKALSRYIDEGMKGSYITDPRALVQLVGREKLLKGSSALIDLGAGPGDFIRELALNNRNLRAKGIDLSPGFVRSFNLGRSLPNATMDVGLIDRPMAIDPRNTASVTSVLTLDRLAYPGVLIENMSKFTRARILATLLPIVPEDDNPSRQGEEKIIYTRPQNRIVPGKDAVEDREILQKILEQKWRRPITFTETNYAVESSGDYQRYKLGVFFTS